MGKKIQKLADLVKIRRQLKRRGKKVVFTNGCFDLLHSGHIHLFREAKKRGDVFIVAVNDDASVKKIKEPSRPIFPLEERFEILEAIEEIDYLTYLMFWSRAEIGDQRMLWGRERLKKRVGKL